jgi:hemerythrin-like metal-binding protein
MVLPNFFEPVESIPKTGIDIIDREHLQLFEFVEDLERICTEYAGKLTCNGCSANEIVDCEMKLLNAAGDVLLFMVEHFSAEELIMKQSALSARQKSLFQVHAEEHAKLSSDVCALLGSNALRQQAVAKAADLAAILSRWLHQHIAEFDMPMMKASGSGQTG